MANKTNYKNAVKERAIFLRNNLHKCMSISEVSHAATYHLDLTDEELICRNKPLASTFVNDGNRKSPRSDLLFFVEKAIEDDFVEDVAEWLEDETDDPLWCLFVNGLPRGFSGRVYIRKEVAFKTCSSTLIMLRKGKKHGSFHIATMFPYATGFEPSVAYDYI